jgi:hypothetical protein
MVGTLLPKGAHRLAFRWLMPAWHKVALIMSLAALAVVLCARMLLPVRSNVSQVEMRRTGLIVVFVRFLRSYLLALALVGALALTFLKSFTGGFGPVPQHPPEGITIVRDSEQLQWSPGARRGPIRLQVSANSPTFSGELFVDQKVKSTRHVLSNLAPGTTYFWRLVQNNESSHVSKFHVAKGAVRY